MVFDAEYYERMQGVIRGVLIQVEDELTPDEAELIGELLDANELGVAVEMLVDLLNEKSVALDKFLAARIADAVTAMGLPGSGVSTLRARSVE